MTGGRETKTIEAPRRTLPPLPQIVDATRREFLIGAAGLLVLAPYGCGGEEARPLAPTGGTRIVRHALGRARVPKNPRRVVALDPFFSLQVAVETGVPVVGSTVVFDDPFDRKPYVRSLGEATGRSSVLFYNVGAAGQGDVLREEAERVVDGPLWQKIPAVQDGKAYRLDPDHWIVFGGLRSANLVLDDVEEHLT